MAGVSARLLVLATLASFCVLSEAQYPTCDNNVLKCIKRVNGGQYPVSLSTPLALLKEKYFSIVWLSDSLIKEDNLSCVTTIMAATGDRATYHHSCKYKEPEFKYIAAYNPLLHAFAIINYKGMNFSAYAIHYDGCCLAMHLCNAKGKAPPHIRIYCPTSQLGSDKVKADIEKAKAKFTICNINDGKALCQEKCY